MNRDRIDIIKGKILIVDDTLENLKFLHNILTARGYEVRQAITGAMALMGATAAPPDLILLDIKMPGMDGYEVCHQLKKIPQTKEIPIIFISALDDVWDKVKAFQSGGVDYITKPFQAEEVLARIEHQINLKFAQAKIQDLNAELEQRVSDRTAQLEVANQELEREIAERKKIEKELATEKAHLIAAQQVAHVGSWEYDAIAQEIQWSEETFRIFGLLPGQPVPTYSELLKKQVYIEDRELWERIIRQAFDDGKPYEFEFRIVRPDGDIRWIFAKEQPILNPQNKIIKIFGTVLDITDRKRAEEQLIYDALHDSLTNLPNRVLLMEHIDRALKRMERYPEYLFAVLFLDLDRFKVINDSLGHVVGDRLLIAIAGKLKAIVRSTDTVARLGGDEFILLIEEVKDINDAIKIAERISEELKSPFHLENRQVFINASIGIAISNSDYYQATDLLRDADIAMYRAKEKGKARYEIFNRVMYAQALKQLQLENDLRQALSRQEFVVHYQPIVSLIAGKITGFEALVRWQHPKRGLVGPAEFIPIAEETGLIVSIGEWVLHSACQQMVIWQNKFPTASSLKLSVNLSGKQLREPNLIEKIDRILARTGLNGANLKLELTESMLMENVEVILNTLSQLRKRNIQLSIDDFGTGYSSLSYLHRFPVNTLKIDRSFVSRIGEKGENLEIVETIVSLAHQLGLDAIAEGVETSLQLQKLKALSCQEAQGYFFSKPLKHESAEASIASNFHWPIG